MMNADNNVKIAMRISYVSIIINAILSLFKFIAGFVSNSSAMISDSIHSLSDVFSTIIVMIGIKLSAKSSDKEHPYGHERFECVAAIILSIILFLVGFGIGGEGVKKILNGSYDQLAIPGLPALIAALVSIAVKEAMYWRTRAAAKKINSGALMADAWHHRSDALSSIGSFAGILGSRMGFPILDSVASLIICLFIIKTAYDIFIDSIGKMTDKSCDDKTTEKIRETILNQAGVDSVDLLQTRIFGNRIYIDVEISAAGNISLYESHEIAHNVHDAVELNFPNIKHCMVHVNPSEENK